MISLEEKIISTSSKCPDSPKLSSYMETNKYIMRPTNEQNQAYFLRLLENVLMTGIPQIVTEHNKRRKIFKLFVFFACIVGFLYQLGSFLYVYLQYPTTLEVLLKYRSVNKLPKPMVTLCNLNGIRRTAYCQKFPENCEKPKNIKKFCTYFEQYCQKENYTDDDLLFPKLRYISLSDHNRTLIKKYGVRMEDILNPYSNFTSHVILANEGIKLRNCYSADLSKIFSETIKNANHTHYSSRLVTESNVFVEMNVTFQPEESFYPTIPIGARISVHSQYQLINPFIDGVLIQPGKKYGVQLKISEQNLLPSPYRTHCKKYDRIQDKTRKKQTYSRHRCLIECSKENWLKKCGCVSAEYPFEFTGKFCDDIDSFRCINKINNEECHNKCPISCRYHMFHYGVDESPIPCEDCTNVLKKPEIVSQKTKKIKYAILSFFVKSPEILIYKYRPQFQMIEVFGYIGGYVGIWLGISLIAVFDFLETLIIYISYRLKGKIPSRK